MVQDGWDRTKITDSRAAYWDGVGQVELDALNPKTLQEMATTSIKAHFDEDAYRELKDQEHDERMSYREALKEFVNGLAETEE